MPNGFRIKSADTFKGLAVVVVVFIHMVILSKGTGNNVASIPVVEVLYAGLPLFYFVAGYFSKYERPFAENAKKRLLKILLATLLCIFVLTAAMAVVMYAYGYPVTWENLYDTTIGYMLSGGGKSFVPFDDWADTKYEFCFITNGYYFLFVMFFSLLLFYCTSWFVMENGKRVFASIAVLLFISFAIFYFIDYGLPFYVQLVPISTALVYLGAYASKKNFYDWVDNGWKKKEYWIAFAVAFIVAFVTAWFFPSHFGFNRSVLGDYPGWSVFSFFVISVAGGYCVCVLCSLFSKIKYLGDFFSFIGQYSLAVYAMHTFFVKVLTAYFYDYTMDYVFPVFSPAVIVIVGILTIALCILTAMFINSVIGFVRTKNAEKQTPVSVD